MLIRFIANNYRAISETVELNLAPSTKVRRFPHHIHKDLATSHKILRGGVIYGANASGKSNLCLAIGFGQFLVLGDDLPKHSTFLEPFDSDKPTKFEYEILIDNIAYSYGFELNSKEIISEWIYEIPANSEEKLIFHRYKENEKKSVYISPDYLDGLSAEDNQYVSFINRYLENNELFLSKGLLKFDRKDSKIYRSLMSIRDWFESSLQIITPESYYTSFESDILDEEGCKSFYTAFLKAFDTGIQDIHTIEYEYSELPKAVTDRIDVLISNEEDGDYVVNGAGTRFRVRVVDNNIQSIHEVVFVAPDNTNKTYFTIDELSDGTRRLTDIVPAIHSAVYHKKTIIIDEIDRSLHPLITKLLLDYFYSENIKPTGQILVTTHESRLMDQNTLRKDEIWFVQKEHDGSSILYSLDEYQIRNDKSIINDYLDGRFGGVIDFDKSKKLLRELINETC